MRDCLDVEDKVTLITHNMLAVLGWTDGVEELRYVLVLWLGVMVMMMSHVYSGDLMISK